MDESEKKKVQHLTVAEELDAMMVVVRSKGWLALICTLVILLAIILWGLFGRIPIKVTGLAISESVEGSYDIVSNAEGTVVKIVRHEGESVEKGQTIVKIIDPVTQLEIEVQKEKIAILQLNLEVLRKKILEEREERNVSLKKKIDSEKYALANQENGIPFLTKDLESKTRLNKQGILPSVDVEKARLDLAKAKSDIEQHRANITSLETELDTEYRENEIRIAEVNLFDAKKQLERLLLGRGFLNVRTHKAGIIIEILVSIGDRIKPGQMVAALEAPLGKEEKMQFYGAVAAEYGILLKQGLSVQIEVAGVDAKQYGYLLGTVAYVSNYPASMAELTANTANPQIAEFLKAGQSAVYSLVIKLFSDPSTISGYKWTTSKGPPHPITTGTLATIRVVVQERKPIYYILPEEIGPYIQEVLPSPETPK